MSLSKNGWISAFAGTFFLLALLVSCEEDLDTLGDGVIANDPFVTNTINYDVFASNRGLSAVQTNRLPLYQLGVYEDPIYGRREAVITTQLTFAGLQGNPTFGNYAQELEDLPEASRDKDTIPENETVKEVILYIPYQLAPASSSDRDGDGVPDELDADPDDPDSDSDGDGVSDIDETNGLSNPLDATEDGTGDDFIQSNFPRNFALDSIFSSTFVGMPGDAYLGKEFTIKVDRSSFFLRDLDPNTNFLENQEYFSNTNITSFVEGNPLNAQDSIMVIDNLEIVTFSEDDENTEDDESLLIDTRQNPGIRVSLDTAFFQENIIDKEGSFELLTQSNLASFIRGLHISLTPVNDDLMVLLDLSQASITITYEFDDFQEEENEDGEVEESIEKVESEFTLNLLQVLNGTVVGNAVNTFIDDPLPGDILSQIDNTQENDSRLYLKGGASTFAELQLFDGDEAVANDIIEEIKANNWVINEANLVFYVDQEALSITSTNGTIEPPRLYLYRADTNQALFNVATEQSDSQDPLGQFLNYDGILQKNSDGAGTQYTIRITEYLNNIIVRDSINAPLRLALTSNITVTGTQEAESTLGEGVDLPVMNTINPLGTILFGNNVPLEQEDKKLKLEILYTETN